MDTEIELKFLVSEQHSSDAITSILNQLQLSFTEQTKALNNCYFDTEDMQLRAADMGLRIRTRTGHKEQTIKTAGTVLSGLHQRPEYNVEISESFPKLGLFPEHIWNELQDVALLQQRLMPLFSTDFMRHTWLINFRQSRIELAHDRGHISSQNSKEAIAELELELMDGSRGDLIALASLLCEHLAMRPGYKSKAARGYELFRGERQIPVLEPLVLIPMQQQYSLEQSFTAGIEFSLNQLQQIIEAYVQQPDVDYLIKITELLALMRHGFWLYQQYLPDDAVQIRDELSHFIKVFSWVDSATHFLELTDKTGNYRKKLEYSQQLVQQLKLERRQFPDAQQVIAIFTSGRFNQLQLQLLSLLLNSHYFPDNAVDKTSDLMSFAKLRLDENLAGLDAMMAPDQQLSGEQYLAQYQLLIRSLLTGSWFGNLYDHEQRLEFRDPWLDIKQGIGELQALWIIKEHLNSLDKCPVKLRRWFDGKVDNLLLALDHSRAMALSIIPYWR